MNKFDRLSQEEKDLLLTDMYEALKEARALNAYKGEELEALFRNWFDIFAAPALAKVQQ